MKTVLKVIGAFLVLGIVFRLLRGGRSRHRFTGGHWRRRMAEYRNAFGDVPGAPAVPIDDQWSRPVGTAPTGAVHSVPVG